MIDPNVEKIIAASRDSRGKITEDAERSRQMDVFFEMSEIALATVYEAAHHGNARCKAAVFEIDKLKALLK